MNWEISVIPTVQVSDELFNLTRLRAILLNDYFRMLYLTLKVDFQRVDSIISNVYCQKHILETYIGILFKNKQNFRVPN